MSDIYRVVVWGGIGHGKTEFLSSCILNTSTKHRCDANSYIFFPVGKPSNTFYGRADRRRAGKIGLAAPTSKVNLYQFQIFRSDDRDQKNPYCHLQLCDLPGEFCVATEDETAPSLQYLGVDTFLTKFLSGAAWQLDENREQFIGEAGESEHFLPAVPSKNTGIIACLNPNSVLEKERSKKPSATVETQSFLESLRGFLNQLYHAPNAQRQVPRLSLCFTQMDRTPAYFKRPSKIYELVTTLRFENQIRVMGLDVNDRERFFATCCSAYGFIPREESQQIGFAFSPNYLAHKEHPSTISDVYAATPVDVLKPFSWLLRLNQKI